jgi:hypothetical protein
MGHYPGGQRHSILLPEVVVLTGPSTPSRFTLMHEMRELTWTDESRFGALVAARGQHPLSRSSCQQDRSWGPQARAEHLWAARNEGAIRPEEERRSAPLRERVTYTALIWPLYEPGTYR